MESMSSTSTQWLKAECHACLHCFKQQHICIISVPPVAEAMTQLLENIKVNTKNKCKVHHTVILTIPVTHALHAIHFLNQSNKSSMKSSSYLYSETKYFFSIRSVVIINVFCQRLDCQRPTEFKNNS